MNKYFGSVFKWCFPFIILSFCFSSSADAKVRFGLHASPQVNWLRSSAGYWKYDTPRFGLVYGLGTEIFFSENYAILIQVDYSNSGGSMTNNLSYQYFTSSIINSKYKLHYLELPIGLKLKTNEIGYFSYFGKFAAVPALILDGTAQYETSNVSSSGSSIQYFKNGSALSQMRTTTLALRIGLGTEYNFAGKSSFVIGLNFTKGITSAMNNVTLGNSVFPNKTMLNALGIDLGILF